MNFFLKNPEITQQEKDFLRSLDDNDVNGPMLANCRIDTPGLLASQKKKGSNSKNNKSNKKDIDN